MLWFNFILDLNYTFPCFKLVIIYYHTQKHRKIKFTPRIQLNYNIYYCDWSWCIVIFCAEYAFYSLLGEFLNFRCVCRILFLNHLTPSLSKGAQVGIWRFRFSGVHLLVYKNNCLYLLQVYKWIGGFTFSPG